MSKSLLALALCLAATASAQEGEQEPERFFPERLTAKDLLFACSSSALTRLGRDRGRYCAGFVSGVEETLRWQQLGGAADGSQRICVPPGTSARDLADAYIEHALRRTTDLRKPAAVVVMEALAERFGCPE
jgi:hypothetical protein